MRAAQVIVADATGTPLDVVVVEHSVEEDVRKAALHTLVVSCPHSMGSDKRLWKNAQIQIIAGVVPAITTRTVVVKKREKAYKAGRVEITLECKCLGGRAQDTVEDVVWPVQTYRSLLDAIAAKYMMVADITAVKADTTMPRSLHQRGRDWDFVRRVCDTLEADFWVQDQVLVVLERDTAVRDKPVRRYDLGSHPVDFEVTEGTMGSVGSKAAGGRRVRRDPITGTVEDSGADDDDAHLGTDVLFTTDDGEGVVTNPFPPETVDGGTYGSKAGADDPGAPTPEVDWDEVDMWKGKARSRRRAARDHVSAGKLIYQEWSPQGTPCLGALIEVVSADEAAAGLYYVKGRLLGTYPNQSVELRVTRHAVNKKVTGKTSDAGFVNYFRAVDAINTVVTVGKAVAGDPKVIMTGLRSLTDYVLGTGG